MNKIEIEKVKKALEKRERILKTLTERKEHLIKQINENRDNPENWQVVFYAENELFGRCSKPKSKRYGILYKVGAYTARVNYYKWKLDYLTNEVQK